MLKRDLEIRLKLFIEIDDVIITMLETKEKIKKTGRKDVRQIIGL